MVFTSSLLVCMALLSFTSSEPSRRLHKRWLPLSIDPNKGLTSICPPSAKPRASSTTPSGDIPSERSDSAGGVESSGGDVEVPGITTHTKGVEGADGGGGGRVYSSIDMIDVECSVKSRLGMRVDLGLCDTNGSMSAAQRASVDIIQRARWVALRNALKSYGDAVVVHENRGTVCAANFLLPPIPCCC